VVAAPAGAGGVGRGPAPHRPRGGRWGGPPVAGAGGPGAGAGRGPGAHRRAPGPAGLGSHPPPGTPRRDAPRGGRMTRALGVVLLLSACSGLGERVGRATRGDAALDSAAVAESTAAARGAGPTAVFDSGMDTTVSWERLEGLVRATPESVRAVM